MDHDSLVASEMGVTIGASGLVFFFFEARCTRHKGLHIVIDLGLCTIGG